jgi:ABC-type transport system substrate-binding protein
MIPANFSVLERVALEVQRQLYNVGIDMQFEVVPARQFDARVPEGRFEAILVDLVSGPTVGRGYQFWESRTKHQGFNVFGYENEEAARVFDVLRTSTNEAAVRSATSRLQRVLLDDPPALFLAWNERARAVATNFDVVLEEGRDPLHTLWRWAEKSDRVQTAQ